MKKLTKSFLFIVLVTIILGSSFLVGCKNPFVDKIVSEEASGSNSGSGSGSNSGSETDVLVDAKSPKITLHPTEELFVTSGVEYTLEVAAVSEDEGVISYQWFEIVDNSPKAISGKTDKAYTSSYTLPDGVSEATFYYFVEITNTNESATGNKKATVKTNSAKVIVNNLKNAQIPEITEEPVSYKGKPIDSYTLSVKVATLTDNGTITYQWYKATDFSSAGEAIPGETSPTYQLSDDELVVGANNYFYVEVKNTILDFEDVGNAVATVVSERVNVKILSIGYFHPNEGNFSPVDLNGSEDGYGWKNLTDKLGATVNGNETTFAVYSKNAQRILLEIYEQAYGENAVPVYDYWMEKGSDDIWRAKINGAPEGTLYAFRAWGPNWTFDEDWTRGGSNEGFISDVDSKGNRFNPNKVLFDPYAKEISHDKSHPEVLEMVTGTDNPSAIYASGERNLINSKPSREFDTGKFNSKAVVVDNSLYSGKKPNIPQEKAIIYEAHVKGITAHPSTANLSSILEGIDGFEHVVDITGDAQGTYKGAGMLAPYLKALGINTIELLPVHESDNEHTPDDKSGGNYWSYMTYGYFAPERRYSSDKSYGGPTREFKEMVDAFHEAGIEVYLDVVYNHSGEGGPWYGNLKKWENDVEVDNTNNDGMQTIELTFMRGLDNSTYYSLTKGDKRIMQDDTGCGNNLQCDNPVVRQLILDSLSYWVDYMGVDGYRFDLSPVLGREYNDNVGYWAYNPNAETLQQIAALGITKNVDMVAEAWDIGAYGVGTFPAGWGEWNGRYRDALRGYIGTGNKSGTDKGDFLQYMNGDYNNFNDQGGPHKSVNFVVAHDGFTLADLCSYEGNGNAQNSQLAWPFGPSDGGNGDYNSLGFGTTPAAKRQANRNYIAIQMMSRGVPMIVWGDELSRTQKGNNNAYNVDSVGTWSNYNMIDTASPHLEDTGDIYGGVPYDNNFGTFGNNADVNGNFMFMKYMLNLKANEPALNLTDYSVYYDFKKEDGTSELANDARCVWVRINGSGVTGTDAEGKTVQGGDYLVFMNMNTASASFAVPTSKGEIWKLLVDTSSDKESNFNYWEVTYETSAYSNSTYSVPAWSVVILKNYGKGTTSTPVISYEADVDTCNMTVSIDCATEGAEIYYTVDGKTPSKSSTKYTGSFPLGVSSKQTVKAIAYKADYNDSGVASKDLHIQKYTIYCKPSFSTVPNVYVWKDGADILKTWPGDAMSDIGNGWYEYEVVDVCVGYDRVIFNDGDGGETKPLPFDKAYPYFNMTGSFTGGWVTSKVETPSTLLFTRPNDEWGYHVYAYFFDDNGVAYEGNYPGIKMTWNGYNSYNQGQFAITVPSPSATKLIISGYNYEDDTCLNKTVDITLTGVTGYYITDSSNKEANVVGSW